MKFIDYLTSITGVGIFPLISLLVFFLFFVLLSVYLVRADKSRMNYLASLPVETEQDQTEQPNNRN